MEPGVGLEEEDGPSSHGVAGATQSKSEQDLGGSGQESHTSPSLTALIFYEVGSRMNT